MLRRTPLARKRATPRRRPSVTCSWTIELCHAIYTPIVISETERYCRSHGERVADVVFSMWVRERDGECVRCRGHADDAAHVIVRSNHYARYDPEGAVALCRKDHAWFTDHEHDWRRFLDTFYPGVRMRMLHKELAGERARASVDVAAVIVEYRRRLVA